MKKTLSILFAIVFLFVIFSYSPSDQEVAYKETLDSSCETHGPTDVYFEPEEYYKEFEGILKYRSNWIKQSDLYESSIKHYLLRPLYTEIAIERNYLKQYTRRCAPYPKEYWDKVSLEVLLPNFEPKAEANRAKFTYKTFDALTIMAGRLSSDVDHSMFMRFVELGRWVVNKETENMIEYVPNGGSVDVLTSYYLYKDVRTLTNKPTLVKCSHGSAILKEQTQCSVRLFLPKELWKTNSYAYRQMHEGLEVSYTFSHKYIEDISEIQTYVLSLVDKVFIDISLTNETTLNE